MRLLFTSAGRRVELIQAFREAAVENNTNLELIGADNSITAPAMYFCDKQIVVPKIQDEEYIPFLVSYCEENDVDALIPTIDTDLLVLADNKSKFMKTKVIISDAESIRLCRDKRLTAIFFSKLGLKCPSSVDDYRLYDKGFPAFIKPKDGSSSINAFRVSNTKELEIFSHIVPDYIIQPFIEGNEYTVDVFCDFDGNPIFITPRERLAVRSGEVLKTRICQDDRIIAEVKSIISVFRPCGPLTVQLIRDYESNEDYFIEINPRFGGGAPLSIKAGANSCIALLNLLDGQVVEYIEKAAEDNAVYSRFDQSIKVDYQG